MVLHVSHGFSLKPVNTRLFSFSVLSSCLTLSLSVLFSRSALRHWIFKEKFSSLSREAGCSMGLWVLLTTREFRLVWNGSSLVSMALSSSVLISDRNMSFSKVNSGLRLIFFPSFHFFPFPFWEWFITHTWICFTIFWICFLFISSFWLWLTCTGWTSLLCTYGCWRVCVLFTLFFEECFDSCFWWFRCLFWTFPTSFFLLVFFWLVNFYFYGDIWIINFHVHGLCLLSVHLRVQKV